MYLRNIMMSKYIVFSFLRDLINKLDHGLTSVDNFHMCFEIQQKGATE